MADLDRRLEAECSTAHRTAVALACLANVGEPRCVVAPGLDAQEVPPVTVGSGNEVTLAQRLVRDDLDVDAYRAEGSSACAECPDLLVGRRR